MKKHAITVATFLLGFSFTACQQSKSTQATQTDTVITSLEKDTILSGLKTIMSAPEKVKKGDPIMLKFTVTNPADKEQEFCKWHTPFEQKFLNSFFEITDSKGEQVQYQGVMAKRMMPPPADAFIKVPAKDSVSAAIDLLTAYKISAPGTYRIVYQGDGISGLKDVNEVTVNVE
jgi:hypothetical protein